MPAAVLIAGAYAYTTTVLGGTIFAFFYLVSWCREIAGQLATASAAAAQAAALTAVAAKITADTLDRKLDQLLERPRPGP